VSTASFERPPDATLSAYSAASDTAGSARNIGRFLRRASFRWDVYYEWRRRIKGPPALPAGRIERVLVLCQGNVCRSPFAAEWLRQRLPSLQIRSAGLRATEDGDPDAMTQDVAHDFRVALTGHRTRRASTDDLRWAQLILAMQGHHLPAIGSLDSAARPRTRLLGDYLSASPYGIPDPWGRGELALRATFERIVLAGERLAHQLEQPLAAD